MSKAGLLERSSVWIDYDLVERVIVSACFCLLAYNMIGAAIHHGGSVNLIILVSEAMVVAFVLVRRRTPTMSLRGADWAAGFAATLAPLLVVPAGENPVVPLEIATGLMLLGFSLQIWAKLVLRRSFGIVAANRGVKVSGPYRILRHPMYAGYALTHIGFLLSGPSVWNLCIYSFVLIAQIVRIQAEERILRDDAAYRTLADAVPYRLVPFVY